VLAKVRICETPTIAVRRITNAKQKNIKKFEVARSHRRCPRDLLSSCPDNSEGAEHVRKRLRTDHPRLLNTRRAENPLKLCGRFEGCRRAAQPGNRLEGNSRGAWSRSRNSLSRRPRLFQNSGKGFWNPVSSCRDGRDNQNNGHDDQQSNQRKTLLFFIHCLANRISYVSSYPRTGYIPE
jgi:hypothetical protein